MCGFVGVLKNRPGIWEEAAREQFKNSNTMIFHRGPDDEGYFEDEQVLFGFRRLSIIDIESGHQPFSYLNERYWMVFNGEVYNYIELRDHLLEMGYTFTTDSDTEVIIALFDYYREEAFEKLRGMFAILIWDTEEQTLFGVRDPFGIKPFYYRETDRGLYFASEKKSIIEPFTESVCHDTLQHYLSFQYAPEPYTISQWIKKIEPGHYFIKKADEPLVFKRYFHSTFQPVDHEKSVFIERIRSVMYDSVNVHMRSDVPVGSFLSGGIDSTIITSIAREIHPDIKTFSVGFEQHGYSEVDVAKETAEALGVQNYEYMISPEEFVSKIPKIIYHLDDPLADPAAIPLYFVAREASKHVTVVLSGEGADELFGGYNIYREPSSLKLFESMPTMLKSALNQVAKIIPEGVKGKSFIERGTTPLKDRYIGNAKIFEEREKQALLPFYNHERPYQTITSPFYEASKQMPLVNQMQYVDIQTWLRGDILLKADRMTMAHALELRVPFLDKEVFNVAREIPVDFKIAEGTTKYILRKAAEGIIPDHVLNRKKLGFPVPIRHWLKNELHSWAKQLIEESETDHLLNKTVIRQLLDDHCQNKADNSRKLWTIFMFMVWHQIYIEDKFDLEALKNEDHVKSKLIYT
jgi:asparagine synthase (glutamine-hydrolysing)